MKRALSIALCALLMTACLTGFPLCVWKSSEEEARSFANRFRAAGYSVDVWEHTETGARKTNI